MKKRNFLKTSTLLLASQYLSPMGGLSKTMQEGPLKNWAGNLTYNSKGLDKPKDLDELASLVKASSSIKPLGTMHSFNPVADTYSRHVSQAEVEERINISAQNQTVTLNGRVQYGVLAKRLQEGGFALHNLASLPHISVAGACATGTHGSGDQNGNLSSSVVALEMLTADGSRVRLSKDQHVGRFNGTVVNLGALGVVTRMTLRILPTFEVVQHVYEELPLRALEEHFEEVFGAAYSVSLFTDWQNESINQVWLKFKVLEGRIPRINKELFGARISENHLHPIKEISPENCTPQRGELGPWHERLPHFKMDFTPSSGEELQSEYFVPRKHAMDAIRAIYRMGNEIYPHLLISEIRSISADRLWLSPAYGRDSIAIHFTWKQDWKNVQKLLPKIEQALLPYQVRPHWGKLFTLGYKHLNEQYERMEDFRDLMQEYDPKGKFLNPFLEKNILGKG
ncbi:D-arabinono-1,4-lactone oxidase [Pleomorphovibrio marinus]|uniref:D-arabinono-1,4-lactone oxidase n=1 Tax=Pleomorphovibrio marinus TaxID=2164132 RepID=UPI000E0B0F84|nr:D-arabinono-1,4-lactone oxidase [Pleomorphovibrio marinus]